MIVERVTDDFYFDDQSDFIYFTWYAIVIICVNKIIFIIKCAQSKVQWLQPSLLIR